MSDKNSALFTFQCTIAVSFRQLAYYITLCDTCQAFFETFFIFFQIFKFLLSVKPTTHSILPHFFIDSVDVKKLNINQCGIERLMRHPYIHFDQAKAIYD